MEHRGRDADGLLGFAKDPHLFAGDAFTGGRLAGGQFVGVAHPARADIDLVSREKPFPFVPIDEVGMLIVHELHQAMQPLGIVVHIHHQIFQAYESDDFPGHPQRPEMAAMDAHRQEIAKQILRQFHALIRRLAVDR